MKKFIKRNKLNIVLVFLSVIGLILLAVFKKITISNYNAYNVISNNAIFGGFLYTGLGIIVSIIDKENIKYLDKHGYMDNYINGIKIGLVFNIISIIAALLLIAFDVKYAVFIKYVSFLSMIIGVVFFIKSVFNIMKLIKIVRNQNNY
jgi:hypothetical protein